MRQLPLLAAVLLTIPAAAQSLPDLKLKEGLWEESTTSTIRPTGTPNTFTTSKCHNHAYDESEMRRGLTSGECKYSNLSQTDSGWQMQGTCSTSGGSIGMKMAAQILDEEHVTMTADAVYPANMPGGMSGSLSTIAMTYKGLCPANMKPGDMLESLPGGKSTVVPGPNSDPRARQAYIQAGINAYSSHPPSGSRYMAQSTPALNQRPTPYSAAHPTGPPISNADVIALASAGLDDDVILAKINAASAARFDTSIDGLKALKAGGVSNAVIKVMVGRATAAEAEAAASSEDPNVMHQPGVYALISGRDGQVHLLQLEHTHAAGENMSGNTLTMAYLHTKKHTRESLNNPTSPVKIEDRNPTFYIYIPQDSQSFGGNDLSARDFELLKLRVKSKTREVETSSTSISGMGASGIEDKARQNTTTQKVKPGIYMVKVTTPLKPGEYAFQHELEGVFYDFTITESR